MAQTSAPKKFDPDAKYGRCRSTDPSIAYVQNGWYYDGQLRPIKELLLKRIEPLHERLVLVAILVRHRERIVFVVEVPQALTALKTGLPPFFAVTALDKRLRIALRRGGPL